MQRVTQREIATALGLSQALVSRALRDDGSVCSATREKVKAKAMELGYQPDLLMASLSTRSHSRAASAQGCPIVFLHQPPPGGRHLRRGDFLARAESISSSRGLVFREHVIGENDSPDRLARIFVNQGVHGVVFASARGDVKWFEAFPTSDFSVVNTAARLAHLPYPTIRVGLSEATEEYFLAAMRKGYRRIGAALFQHDPDHPDDKALRGSFLYAQQKWGPGLDSSLLFDVPQRSIQPFEKTRRAFLDWVVSRRPDSLLLFSRREWNWLSELPEIAGVRGVVLQVGADPESSIAHIHSPWDQVAELVIQEMESSIRMRRTGVRPVVAQTFLPASLIDGETFPDRQSTAATQIGS